MGGESAGRACPLGAHLAGTNTGSGGSLSGEPWKWRWSARKVAESLAPPARRPALPVVWTRVLGLALVSLLSLHAQTSGPQTAAPSKRYLVVVDTSRGMQRGADTVLKVVQELLNSGMRGQLRLGDTVGLWTFNEELAAGRFPLQTWSLESQPAITSRVVDFLKHQVYEKESRVEAVVPALRSLIARSDYLTVVLISDGDEKTRLSPAEELTRGASQQRRGPQQQVPAPLVTIVRARDGRITDYSVTRVPGPLEMPLWSSVVPESSRGGSPLVEALRQAGTSPEPPPIGSGHKAEPASEPTRQEAESPRGAKAGPGFQARSTPVESPPLAVASPEIDTVLQMPAEPRTVLTAAHSLPVAANSPVAAPTPAGAASVPPAKPLAAEPPPAQPQPAQASPAKEPADIMQPAPAGVAATTPPSPLAGVSNAVSASVEVLPPSPTAVQPASEARPAGFPETARSAAVTTQDTKPRESAPAQAATVGAAIQAEHGPATPSPNPRLAAVTNSAPESPPQPVALTAMAPGAANAQTQPPQPTRPQATTPDTAKPPADTARASGPTGTSSSETTTAPTISAAKKSVEPPSADLQPPPASTSASPRLSVTSPGQSAAVVAPKPLLGNGLLWLAGLGLAGAVLTLAFLLRRRTQAVSHASLITSSIDRQTRK